MQEAHAQAQAARQQQIESQQRQQPPAHQDGGRSHDKRGR